ncbi:HAMP domain-containing histidine kinase [Mucilaginibacter sp. RS28]|uniref:histidine kinase n=1 Tax=Mucilaginibacter straminoryzae TaxID=2932774 RepID=A0A9X1X3N1_9SPHI|nr:HAMP domain-containing sensor histidine kinase [Mucilaginibacter straminoryzae]MCJ8210341.1 HAMP domain-containing histidine kinase [Mucilaginibacter straminoryzae]
MKIKDRLALHFSIISAVTLLLILGVIYFLFYGYLKSDFFEHLHDRANVVAQLYLEADEIAPDSLNQVKDRYLVKLPDEQIGIYDLHNRSFLNSDARLWSAAVINKVRKKGYLELANGDRQTLGLYYKDNQGNFVILVSAVAKHNLKRLADLRRAMVILFLVIASGFFLIGRLFAERALAPLHKLMRQLQLIRVNNLHLRVDEGNGKDEVASLARYFNELLSHLQNAFELQQTFVVNASHELRTPVTSMIGEAELGLSKPRTPEYYRQILEEVLKDSLRLNETISSLVELAQTDMEYTRASLAPVAVDDLIWELQDYWNVNSGGKFMVNIEQLPDEKEKLQIKANKSLLLIALNNIILNAYKFSDGKPVKCTLYGDGTTIRIGIQDEGIGIPAAELDKVFLPFYRSSNARSLPGSGIGLYMTKKIIQLYKGEVSLERGPGQGTLVTVVFTPVFF